MSTYTMTVSRLTRADEDAVVATILLAFATDPVARWVFPDAKRYTEYFPRVVRGFGGGAFDCGGAQAVNHVAGVALWLAPGVTPDEQAMGAALQEALSPAEFENVMAFMSQMGEFHPHEPHWYLPLIGVDPAYHGRGLGSQLLERMCNQCDRDGIAAYLEASSSRNVSLYERFGFVRTGSIQTGDSPVMRPMLRKPR